MTFIEQFDLFRVSKFSFPVTNYLYNRRHILRNFKELMASEWYTQEVLRSIQLRKLKSVVAHAHAFVPYYQKIFSEIGLVDPRDIKDFDDFRHIPPITRGDVIDFHKEMVDVRYASSIPIADSRKVDPGTPLPFARFRKHRLVRNTSSGSTGAPTIFYEDGCRTALNWVHEMRLKQWFGVPPCSKEARLVRLSVDYKPHIFSVRVRKFLWNQLLLPGTNLSDENYKIIIDALMKFRPKVLWGFPSALAGLSDFVLRTNYPIKDYSPQVAIGWAGPVYDHEENSIINAFKCKVSNNYGAREVGHVAGKCPNGTYHVNQETHLVEIDPRDDIDQKHGVGEILVTPLDLSPMPFIRYRMGDVGALKNTNCACGRKLISLSDFLGRTGEIFRTKDGRMISPNFWCRFFFVNELADTIKRFQIIYKKNRDVKLVIEPGNNYSSSSESYIQSRVRRNFGANTHLEIVYVNKIEAQVSGKYKMVSYE